MSMQVQGGNVIVDASVAGSLFPRSEKEMVFPVLLDGSARSVVIDGALYGRSVEMRGDVTVNGPIVVRGDTKLTPGAGRIRIGSGFTINGSLNGLADPAARRTSIQDGIENAAIVVKGDVCVNQNVALKNSIVFGSIRAVNCSLENSLVLGTCIVSESLRVSASSIGGYASRDVAFAGPCAMLHALGESRSQPLFVPFEAEDGTILPCDVRYYPAIRGARSLMNRLSNKQSVYAEYSQLFPETDWVPVQASANSALEEDRDEAMDKWVLSIGGRIGDFSKISHAMTCLTNMLKCGFEYEHYHLAQRPARLQAALHGLTEEEQWILKTVCQ